MGLSAKQYHLLKYIAKFENGVPTEKARKLDQRTLGSLFFRKLVTLTRRLTFTITPSGYDLLHFYSSVEISRKIAGKWAKSIHIQKFKLEITTKNAKVRNNLSKQRGSREISKRDKIS